MKVEQIASGVNCGEGPTWRAATNDLIVTSVMDGVLWRIDPYRGTSELFADVGGGANSSAPCADGGVLVTQMGGLDFSLLVGMMPMPVVNPVRWEPACVQQVSPAGVVTPLCGLGLVNTPNDLVVDHANNVWFTDPDYNPSRGPVIARVFRYRAHDVAASGRPTLDPAGRLEVWDEFVDYVNGIALAPDGTIIVAEQDGLRRLDPTTGAREWIVNGIAHIDGFTVDAAGRMYCCSPGNGVNIYEPDGTHVERMALPDGSFNLNCCFGGPELRTLFITDVARAGVLAVEGLPTPGCEVFAYRD